MAIAAIAADLRVLLQAALMGAREYGAVFRPRTWLLGWFLRVLAQVSFFALIGQLLRSAERTHFLLVGNAVMIAAIQALGAVASVTFERQLGTLPLLLASPSRATLVFAGRGLHWIADAVVSSVGSLVLVGIAFGLHLSTYHVLEVVPLIMLVALTSYLLGIVLGMLVLGRLGARNVVANVVTVLLMAITGVNIPVSSLPSSVRWFAEFLPVTHGLRAIRHVLASGMTSTVVRPVLLEAAVGAGWLFVGVVLFSSLTARGRRDGTVEFAS